MSFQAVTGFKADFWLVQTVGLLLVVSGAVMLRAASTGRITPEIGWLGAGQALELGIMDIYAVTQPRTTPVYWRFWGHCDDMRSGCTYHSSWMCE
jgi:hypothetical protein